MSLTGLRVEGARKKIVEQLRESANLVGEPVPLKRPVRFYEKGDRPLELEYVTLAAMVHMVAGTRRRVHCSRA